MGLVLTADAIQDCVKQLVVDAETQPESLQAAIELLLGVFPPVTTAEVVPVEETLLSGVLLPGRGVRRLLVGFTVFA